MTNIQAQVQELEAKVKEIGINAFKLYMANNGEWTEVRTPCCSSSVVKSTNGLFEVERFSDICGRCWIFTLLYKGVRVAGYSLNYRGETCGLENKELRELIQDALARPYYQSKLRKLTKALAQDEPHEDWLLNNYNPAYVMLGLLCISLLVIGMAFVATT